MTKNKKLGIILSAILSVVAVATVVVSVVLVGKKQKNKDNPIYVTVTFVENGGSKVDSISIIKGEKIETLPQTYLAGSSFIGWYTDETLTESFFSGTVINEDTTVYAGFVYADNDLVETASTELYSEACDSNLAVNFISDDDYSEEEFLNAITIEAISGELPSGFAITRNGNVYTLTATGGYSAGKLYKITVPSDIRFKDLDEDINEYTFRIDKEESDTVELKDDIIYVIQTELHAYSKNDYGYQLAFKVKTADVSNFFNFEKGSVICLGETREYDYETSMFLRVTEILEYTQTETIQNIDAKNNKVTDEDIDYTYYYLSAVDADVEDVYNVVDIKFEDAVPTSDIIDQIDVEEITNLVYSSGAFDKVTTLVSTLLAESESIQEVMEYSSTSQSTSNGPEFTRNAYVIDGTLKNIIKAKITDGAKVVLSIGEGYNPNFSANYTDNFVVLRVSFIYEATIKNKVKIKVDFTLTEYVAVTMQGCFDYSIFGDKWLYFDYALNIYSQTDIDMSILFCSTNKDDDYRDISQEIKDKLSKDNEEEPNNLVQQLKEMLDSESGDIELFRTNLLHIDYKIIPICPIMQANIDFDFVVKMNFAAGLATDISILEATQVGVTGDTRKDYIKSYKHDLWGGNRYSIELTACGYVGIKAGFEGGLTVSFCGLSRLGKVGVFVFVGPYVDLYGFAQLTIAKDTGPAKASLVGGYYIEIGMNLEISLEARSDLFKVKVGVTLIDVKWPLVSFGNKDVLLSMDGSDLADVFIAGEAGDLPIGEYNTATLSLNTLSPLKGRYIDITTGKITTKDIPWTNIYLRFSNYKFTLDSGTGIVTYRNGDWPRPASEECTVYYYYTGPCLQFNLSASQSENYYKFGTSRIVYYDKSIVSSEDAGKTFTANVYTELDGVKTLVDSYKVLAGSRLRFIETGIDIYQYMDISWNKDPKDTYIVEDTDFIQYGYSRQSFVAFIYYEEGTTYDDPGIWYTEIRPVDLGEKPSVPTLPADGTKTKFVGWNATLDGVTLVGNDIVAVPSLEDIRAKKSAGSYKYTHGQDTSTYYDKYVNESSQTVLLELYDHYYGDDGGMWGVIVEYVYLACYDEEDCVITTITDIEDNEWADGCQDTDEYTLEYGSRLAYFYTLTEMRYRFRGFSLTKGGEIVYDGDDTDATIINMRFYKDLTLYMVYEPIVHTVTLQYYDDEKGEYIDYKTYQIGRSWKLGRIDIDYAGAEAKLVKVEGVEYKLLSWLYRYDGQLYKDYATTESCIYRDIEIYPVYRRKVTMTLTHGSDSEWATETTTGYYTDSVFDYTTYIGNICYKAPDNYNDYQHTGWKNTTTGVVYPISAVYCDYPATFEPVFTTVPKVYTLTITTTKGVLDNGETSRIIECGYDDYCEYVNHYLNDWSPNDVRADDEHCYYSSNGFSQHKNSDEIIYLIEFNLWKKVLDKHTITISGNGGTVIFATDSDENQIYSYENQIDYGSNFYLTNIYAGKTTDLATYTLTGWQDSDGNFYAKDGTYVVSKNTTLSAVWEIKKYFDYTVTYYLNDEEFDEKTYHYADEIDLSQPEETNGFVFDGWKLYYAEDTETEIFGITQMPNKNLVAKANSHEVFIYYYVDNAEISKTHGSVGSNYSVNKKYVKKGYTVSEWQTENVTVLDNNFTMPSNDVVFRATTTINSYTLTYYHKNAVLKQESIEYGTFVLLIDEPNDDGKTYVWTSSDVSLIGNGFTMPDHSVSIESSEFVKTVLVVYYVGDSIYNYATANVGQSFTLIEKPNGVENWYVDNVAKTQITIPDSDVCVYSAIRDIKYTITFDIDSGLDYNVEDYPENQTVAVNAGEKYYLPTAPSLSSDMVNYKTDGWYSIDAEILKDDNDERYYILMPNHDVTIHAFAYPCNSGGKIATTYLVTDEEIEFLKYNVVDDDAPIYFEYPTINGYQFVHWEDADGNIYDEHNGITLSKMEGEDKKFYAIYRKVELRLAIFELNGEIIGYTAFYDKNIVQINIPTVTLGEGETFSGWENSAVKLYDMGSFAMLYLDADNSLTSKTVIFQGTTQKEN